MYTIEIYRIYVNRAAPVSTEVLMSVAQRDLRNLILLSVTDKDQLVSLGFVMEALCIWNLNYLFVSS